MGKLSDKLALLAEGRNEKWAIESEPHDYPDGTKHFTHVVFVAKDKNGDEMKVRVMDYSTPEAAELAVLLNNNVQQIVAALRAFGN